MLDSFVFSAARSTTDAGGSHSLISSGWARAFIITSVIIFIVACIKMIKYAVFHSTHRGRHIPSEECGIVFMLRILLATTLVRYAVVRAGAFVEDGIPVYGLFKSIVDSFIYSMQSFTMDADYVGFLSKGSSALRDYLGMPAMARFFEIYVSILNPICAVSGGAVLLTIIIKLFPNIKLRFARAFSQRPLYYFSKLNDESLALAKSIYNKYNDKQDGNQTPEKSERPRLIFCDADTEDDSIPAESIERAKQLRAVLVKTSLSELELDDREKKKFFLIGTDEENLTTLSSFTAKGRIDKLNEKNAIYVFSNENYGTLVENNVRERINLQLNPAAEKGTVDDKKKPDKKITLFSVNRYRSMVYDLLINKPLYSALESNAKDLKIAIFGSGLIGTEMFLAAYWCGQMLDRELKITVISDEKQTHFEKRIDHINSDILKTSKQNKDDKLMCVYPEGQAKQLQNDPYFSYEYVESDVYLDGLTDILCKERRGEKENGRLADFAYFVVALGSDKKNMEVTEQIARIISIKGKPERKIPIACAIWDDEMNSILKEEQYSPFYGAEVYPFGSLKESFNVEKVLLEEIKKRAEGSKDAYERLIAQKQSKNEKLEQDPYAYWANVARAIHVQYKATCIGMSSAEEYLNAVKVENAKIMEKIMSRANELAWLEHRRWNAFMRTEGFRCPTEDEEAAYIDNLPYDLNDTGCNVGKHKNIELKLHPCIVECDDQGMKADLFASNMYNDDILDGVSRRFKISYKEKNLRTYDFKMYDYPEYE